MGVLFLWPSKAFIHLFTHYITLTIDNRWRHAYKVSWFEVLLSFRESALLDEIDRHRSRRKSALLDEIDPWPLHRIVFPEIDRSRSRVASFFLMQKK